MTGRDSWTRTDATFSAALLYHHSYHPMINMEVFRSLVQSKTYGVLFLNRPIFIIRAHTKGA
jgi:hypothetical protein